MELGAAEPHLTRQLVDAEVGVLDIIVDGAHHTVHQRVVVALHLYVLHLVGLGQRPRELTPETAHVLHEVVDEHVEFLHVEGFGEIGIGTFLQSLKAVAHLGLRREHDDGDVADVGIALDFAEQTDAVHHRHHHVGHHQVVGFAGEQHLQGILAVGSGVDPVPVGQLFFHITGHLHVIVDDEQVVIARGLPLGSLSGHRLFLLHRHHRDRY